MNLLLDPWMPVRLRNGGRDWISPARLTDPDVVAFDADRPDFNGALAQFAIGLLQSATPVNSASEWRKCFKAPPTADTLKAWFAPIEYAFVFDGDGARFMQDRSLKGEEFSDICRLFIDSPGVSTEEKNKDHFVKRGRLDALCPQCAALALLTLQINAPSGGSGVRTGLRGGGPLTTLVWHVASASSSLWHGLWLNVRERDSFVALSGDSVTAGQHLRFPWLTNITEIQKTDGATAPAQVHPDHVFWAMPRRIRLDLEHVSNGPCDLCARPSTGRVQRYVARKHGLNYEGAWEHPLSPYYEGKEGWLPELMQPNGLGYRRWLTWVASAGVDAKRPRKRARVVAHALEHRGSQIGASLSLWAFGYDMDNMKARCWYESRIPLYGLADCTHDEQRVVEVEIGQYLAAAELAVYFLRSGVKDAWFGADARGDFSHIDASFWSATEAAFYRQLETRIAATRDAQKFDRFVAAELWLTLLKQAVMKLFDEVFVGAGAIERQHPRRSAQARRKLLSGLHGSKLRESLGLPVTDAAAKKAKAVKAKKLTEVPTQIPTQVPTQALPQAPVQDLVPVALPSTDADGAQLSLELS